MRTFVSAVIAAAMAIALIELAGVVCGRADLLAILVTGSIGSTFAITGTILKSVPLLLTGLAVAIAFRAGVWNIGGEGQFIIGAIAAFLCTRWGMVPALAASFVAGAIWASMATLMRLWRNAPEVLTTILLNFVALHLLGYCVNGPLQESSRMYPQTNPVPDHASLPQMLMQLHWGVAIAGVSAVASWWLLYRTREGLRLRAAGFNPVASRWAGIAVDAQIARAMALSGAVAGLGGGIELLGGTHRLFERFAAGYGYSGIAVALLAQLHPLATILAALFFGALVTGAGEVQRAADISSSVATLGQAVVILLLILFARIDPRAGTLAWFRRWFGRSSTSGSGP